MRSALMARSPCASTRTRGSSGRFSQVLPARSPRSNNSETRTTTAMNRLRHRRSSPLLAALVLGTLAVGLTTAALARQAATNDKQFAYAVGLWGDLPYSDVQATTGVPNLI